MRFLSPTKFSQAAIASARFGAIALALFVLVVASVRPSAGQDRAVPSIRMRASGFPPSGPDIDIYPDGLPFYDQQVGKLSSVETVNVINSGTATLTINSIVASAGFSATNNCGGSLAPGLSCAVSVRFKPTVAGPASGTLKFTDNAPGSPQIVTMSGNGVSAGVVMLPLSLTFDPQPVGVLSGALNVVVTNTTGTAITLSGVTASTGFSQTNSCGTTIGASPQKSCVVSVTFKPGGAGTINGTLTLTDSAGTQTLPLSGLGATPAITLTPPSLAMGSIAVGKSSVAKTSTVANAGGSPVSMISIIASGDYTQTNNCPTTLAVGTNCSLTVTFTPSATGNRAGRVTLNDTDAGSLQTLTLTGTGVAPVTTVTINPRVASLTETGTQQFQALISGVVSSNVNWLVDGVAGGNSTVGTISTAGLYTPPATAGRHTIKAVSIADQSQSGVAPVVVTNFAGNFTYHNDLARTGANTNETVLNTGNVNSAQFGKLFSYPLDGKPFAQPLYVANLAIPGQGTHNVVYVATEHDGVYAFDADGETATPLWYDSFVNPAAGITTVSIGPSGPLDIVCDSMFPEVGITGTPVIDPSSNTMYLVARTKEISGGQPSFVQRLHAIDITTGAERPNSPVAIQASIKGQGIGNNSDGDVDFDPLGENQRSGLVLLNGEVYIAWASFCDPAVYHGWLMGYDANTLQQTTVFNTTPNGWAGGIWAAGAAPAADSSGNLFFSTGNGTFDVDFTGSDYADSVLKMTNTSGQLTVADHFTPYDQYFLNSQDLDLGSTGVIVLPDQPQSPSHLLLAGSKEGTIYLLDRDNMGGFNDIDNSQAVESIPHAVGKAATGEVGMWPLPCYWQNQIYYVVRNDVPKAFRFFNSEISDTPVSKGKTNFGWAAASPTVSANGNARGIVWFTYEPTPKSNLTAVLYAYDAANMSLQLYNSSINAGDKLGNSLQFAVPTVANGKVYVGSVSELDIFGLLP
jgi:hypothetical protein